MKHSHLFLIAAAAASLLAPAPAHAAFDPAIVAGDARWLVHVDLVALRETQLGQALLAGLEELAPHMQRGGLQPDFEKILATAGTLTAYGSNFAPDPKQLDGTLVLRGTPDLRKIAEGFVAQATVTEPEKITEISGLPFEAYALQGGVMVAFPPEPVILFSKSQEQLTRAYDVLRGAATSLKENRSSSLRRLLPDQGRNFLIAASEVPNTEGLLPAASSQSRILKMASALSLALGEEDAMTSARLQLVATSDEMAEKLGRILQGMAALVSLMETNDEDLAEFLRSVTTRREGERVSLSLAYPSERLINMMAQLREHAAQAEGPRSQGGGNRARAEPASTREIGRVVGTWLAEADLPGVDPRAENLTTHTLADVALAPGDVVTISGRRGGGEHARIDYVEIVPPEGTGPAMRYEAEFMRLENYRIERLDFASGGELVRLNDGNDQGFVSFPYQGPAGTFRVTIRFGDESDGQSSFALGVRSSAASPADEPASP